MKVRKLNEVGLAKFLEYVLTGANGAPPLALLNSPETSGEISWTIAVDDRSFKDRYEFGEYLRDSLSICDHRTISFDSGLWSWLALLYFEQLCPVGADGLRKVYKEYAYVFPQGKGVEVSRHYYRHLVRSPYILVREHGNNSKFLLSGAPLWKRGELIEQLAARQSILGSKSAIAAAHLLYFDNKAQKFVRGATGRGRPGTVDRFVGILRQFERTFDTHVMSGEQVVAILPREFERWKQRAVPNLK